MSPVASSPSRKSNPLTVVLVLSGVFFVIFLVASAALFMTRSGSSSSSSKQSSGALFAGGGSIGVIELNGVIMDSKKMLKKLERFEEDSEIKGVVLRLNSPGGSVAPSQEIYEAVKAYKKPLVVSMSSVAASGAFYIACAAKKVYANPGTITGSIGVIMEFLNLEKLYEWAKVKRFSIKTGKFKDAGAEYRDMTSEERALLQGMVDDVLSQFKKAVSDGRKLPLDKVTMVADGRIFSGSQAKALHLVDELGTLQDAIDDVAKQAKLKGKPNVVYPDKPHRKLLESLLSDGGSDDGESSETRSTWISLLLRSFGLRSAENESPLGVLESELIGHGPGIYWLWNGVR